MAELYNKVGVGLMTWSPVSLGLALGSREEQLQVFTKLAVKVHTTLIVLGIYYIYTVQCNTSVADPDQSKSEFCGSRPVQI